MYSDNYSFNSDNLVDFNYPYPYEYFNYDSFYQENYQIYSDYYCNNYLNGFQQSNAYLDQQQLQQQEQQYQLNYQQIDCNYDYQQVNQGCPSQEYNEGGQQIQNNQQQEMKINDLSVLKACPVDYAKARANNNIAVRKSREKKKKLIAKRVKNIGQLKKKNAKLIRASSAAINIVNKVITIHKLLESCNISGCSEDILKKLEADLNSFSDNFKDYLSQLLK